MLFKDIDRDKISPMMKQYCDIKDRYSDYILFFRLGDFYEMFFDDAITVSRALELTLTGRDCGLEERAPMCGVPFHSADVSGNGYGCISKHGVRSCGAPSFDWISEERAISVARFLTGI